MSTEENILIAQFMGAVVYGEGSRKLISFPDLKTETEGHISNNRSLQDLHYHSNWNWLIPVVEKIEDLGSAFEIYNNYCKIIFNDVIVTELEDNSKIETVYNACVDFIKWQKDQSIEN